MTAQLMTADTTCAEVRKRELADGSLLGLFSDASGRIVLATAVGEGTAEVDELFLRHLVAMVSDVAVAAVVFAVARTLGKPLAVDRKLWRELTIRLEDSPTDLLDLVVVGDSSFWSAAASTRRRS